MYPQISQVSHELRTWVLPSCQTLLERMTILWGLATAKALPSSPHIFRSSGRPARLPEASYRTTNSEYNLHPPTRSYSACIPLQTSVDEIHSLKHLTVHGLLWVNYDHSNLILPPTMKYQWLQNSAISTSVLYLHYATWAAALCSRYQDCPCFTHEQTENRD